MLSIIYCACSGIVFLISVRKTVVYTESNKVAFQLRGLDVKSIVFSTFLIQKLRNDTDRSIINGEKQWY